MKNVFDVEEGQPSTFASYPAFDRRHLRTIELAIRAAWSDLHKDSVKARRLSIDDEEHISHMLRESLNAIRESETRKVPGYNYDLFQIPYLGAEIITSEGKIRKPDIVFSLAGRPRPGVSNGIHDGIFVECKILGQKSSTNLSNYCKKGLHRFVEGSYAAWMREGMMLAYVRTTQELSDDLAKQTSKPAMRDLLESNGKLSKCTLTRITPSVYISHHRRDNVTLGQAGNPGPIEVRHLWLNV
ncbi:MAG: hypothetical protein KZQ92_16805 [Candidatus Thiodiazotropha sp. (ex Lucinoma borealis)]|nr:hypothetical protein [Candidatus Thiodiazotropha sp. (ex Lucinoma borealis)]MCU7865627.1 hypothetical protein [Candidatus Thiodiazotropha sp. (ex Lucinoma borealis)]